MKIQTTKLAKLFLPSLFLLLANPAYAQIGLELSKQGDRGVKVSSVQNTDTIFGLAFQNILFLLFTVGGLGFVVIFVWGAVSWILSGGDKEKIAGARKRITTAIIGLALLSLTFTVMQVVGQVLDIKSLQTGTFDIPRLTK